MKFWLVPLWQHAPRFVRYSRHIPRQVWGSQVCAEAKFGVCACLIGSFLDAQEDLTPGTLMIDQKGFHILCLLEPTSTTNNNNSLRALLTRNMDFLWSCWKPYHPIIMEDLRYFRSQMTVRFCAVPGLLSSSTTTAVPSRSSPEFLLLLLLSRT